MTATQVLDKFASNQDQMMGLLSIATKLPAYAADPRVLDHLSTYDKVLLAAIAASFCEVMRAHLQPDDPTRN